MKSFRKWLLYSDAKAPLLVALACFLAVSAWLAWQEFDRVQTEKAKARAAAEEAARPKTPPQLDPVQGLGVLPYVERQLSPDTLIIPVDPFLPTYEALVVAGIGERNGPGARPLSREDWRERRRERRDPPPGGRRQPDDDWDDPRATPPGTVRQPATTALLKPRLTYNGFLQRPDGTFAPLFHDNTDKSRKFAAAGSEIHGVKVLSADKNLARVQTPDGTVHDLKLGDGVDLPQ
ncbi:MAG: hypothetical protein ACOX5G_00350 [Kiritimatiellia bacterium]|jgi:hypothetical protein